IIMLFLGFVLQPIQSIPGGKWIYIVCIILLLWGFALFTGGSPSVIRAVTMFSGFALTKYSHRIHSTFHLLVVSMFLLLVFYPPFLYQVGFQMSYLAVLGIIKVHPLLQKLWQPRYLVIQKLWEITSVCLAAQIAVAPLSIFYFHQFPGLFLLSNWLILPFFGLFLITSVGLVALMTLNIEIQPLNTGYEKIVSTMNDTILWIANQESFLFQNMRLSVSVLVTIYILLCFLYWSLKFHKMKYFTGTLASLFILQIVFF
ncbi:MAG: ComEC/Rec2 family competence protein, partial [Flavobacteriaceae bacterium]